MERIIKQVYNKNVSAVTNNNWKYTGCQLSLCFCPTCSVDLFAFIGHDDRRLGKPKSGIWVSKSTSICVTIPIFAHFFSLFEFECKLKRVLINNWSLMKWTSTTPNCPERIHMCLIIGSHARRSCKKACLTCWSRGVVAFCRHAYL